MRLRTPTLALLLSGLLCAGVLIAEHALSDSLKIVDFEFQGDTVRYAYVGEKLPDLFEPNEVKEKRTESSYTVDLGINEKGERVSRTRAYTGPTFVRNGLAWHAIEYGTATPERFAKLTRPTTLQKLARVVATPTYAVQLFGDAGDGFVSQENGVWNTVHDATSGFSASGDDEINVYVGEGEDGYVINRGFAPFETSSIPSGATITAASVNVYVTIKVNSDNDGNDFITVIRTDQANYASLTTADFNNAGATDNPTEGVDAGQRKDIGSISTSAYLSFTLNATGISWIAKSGEASNCHSSTTGITCLGFREGHDVVDNPIASDTENGILISGQETTGTSQDPYLDVTYTEGDAPTVTTSAESGVTGFKATLNGNISDDGGAAASTCGFAWGTNSGLSGGDTGTTTNSTCPASTGAFTGVVYSLVESTTYYARAYATNSSGTGYGSIDSLATPVSRKIRLIGVIRIQGGTYLR